MEEIRAPELPPPTLENLEKLRAENCGSTARDFKLQSFQLFLRRILSPDSPTRNALLFHGTGVGKTCTAIQVAEEYIMRPEFQEKKVLVLASAAVQENFRTQVFDVTRVKQDPTGILMSQQCTGRRYLEMLERAQSEWLRWENPESRDKLNTIVQNMVDDFYEFQPYQSWGNEAERKRLSMSPREYEDWIHATYDDRLLIVDEAHNLREDEETNKTVSDALTRICKTAKGMTLVLLSATPMYDSFDEILFFFNLFLWNDHRQPPSKAVKLGDLFDKSGGFKSPETEALFRGWCHEYISFLRGENPFTFPFRLPPPDDMVARLPSDRTTDVKGGEITQPRKYLPLTVSRLQFPQAEAVRAIRGQLSDSTIPTIVVSPDGRPISKCFERGSDPTRVQFKYATGLPPFLSPSNLPKYAAKFATILKCITDTSGIVFVYSNYVRGGVQQFAMALEEAGFIPAAGPRMLETTSGEYTGPTRGKYAFLTSDMRERQIEQLIRRLRRPENANGQDIRIILGSPLVSEGIDFRNVRQVHILDPWYNMSRMEQIIGRGLRTCSHSGLPFAQQNCTVYLHISQYEDSTQETYDEYIYRVFVEEKASKIARVKQIISESAMDCSLQLSTNALPTAWKQLIVPQSRSQDPTTPLRLPLASMSAPTFQDGTPALVCAFGDPALPEVRPLGAYFDIRDEVFDNLIQMFEKKTVWSLKDLQNAKELRYAPEVVQYLLEDAVHTHLKLKDTHGRIGVLENREGVYTFTPEIPNPTMLERSVKIPTLQRANIPVPEEEKEDEDDEEEKEEAEDEEITYVFPFDTSAFTPEVLEWFVVDQKVPPAQKVKMLQRLDRSSSDLPLWAQGMFVPGIDFLAISPREIYDSENNLVEPVGAEKDAVKLWTSVHIDRLVEEIKTNNKIVCTLEDQTLKFAAFEVVDGHVSRIKRTKTITPKACSFFVQTALSAMVKDCTGKDFPPGVKTKELQCIYLSLAVRSAFLAKSPYVVWVPPEVWSFLTPESATIRAKLA